MPPGGHGGSGGVAGGPAALRRRQHDRDGGAAGRDGPPRRVQAGAVVVHGGVRRGRIRVSLGFVPGRHWRAGAAASPGRGGPGRRSVRPALSLMRRAAVRLAGARGRRAGPAQRLCHQQAGAGAPGRELGAADRRDVRGAAVPQRVRAADAAGHAVLGGGGDLPVVPGERGAATRLRGRRPATRLRARPRRGGVQRAGAFRRLLVGPGRNAACLQRGKRHPADGRGDGLGAGRGLRRVRAAEDHRGVPARRRPPYRGLSRGGSP